MMAANAIVAAEALLDSLRTPAPTPEEPAR